MTTRRKITAIAPGKKPPRGKEGWFHRHSRSAKALMGVVSGVLVVFAGAIAVDRHYARAGDVSELRLSIDRNQLASEISIMELRKAQVTDKVYDAAAKQASGKVSVHERVSLDRYKAELEDVDRLLRIKQRTLEQMRVPK